MKIVRLAWDSGAFGSIRGFKDSFFTGAAFFGSVDPLFMFAGDVSTAFVCLSAGFSPPTGGGETGLERLAGR
jgi:hypothetical protein